jgi:transcriptional regulator with XRE-family HTH domain
LIRTHYVLYIHKLQVFLTCVDASAIIFEKGAGRMTVEFDRAGFYRQVGLRLQRTRKSKGMTQEEIAKRIGVPRPSYANLESGRQRVPVDFLWRAAVVLGESIASFVPEPMPQRAAIGAVASVVSLPALTLATLPYAYTTRVSPARREGESKLLDFTPQRRATKGDTE